MKKIFTSGALALLTLSISAQAEVTQAEYDKMSPDQQAASDQAVDAAAADQDNTNLKDVEDPHAYAEDLDHQEDGLDHAKEDNLKHEEGDSEWPHYVHHEDAATFEGEVTDGKLPFIFVDFVQHQADPEFMMAAKKLGEGGFLDQGKMMVVQTTTDSEFAKKHGITHLPSKQWCHAAQPGKIQCSPYTGGFAREDISNFIRLKSV